MLWPVRAAASRTRSEGLLPLDVPLLHRGQPFGSLLLFCTDVVVGSTLRVAFLSAAGRSSGVSADSLDVACAKMDVFIEYEELIASCSMRQGVAVHDTARTPDGKWIITERKEVLQAEHRVENRATLDIYLHPSQVCPSFESDLIALRWRLRCCFVLVSAQHLRTGMQVTPISDTVEVCVPLTVLGAA